MKKEKGGIIWLILIVGFMIGTGVWYFITEWQNIVNEFNDNHTSLDAALLNNEITVESYYSTNIDASLGCFATKTEGNDVKEAYYIIWLSDGSFAAASVRGSDCEKLDEIADATWGYINGETEYISSTPFTGTVQIDTMGSSTYTMYMQTLEEMGVSGSDYVIRDVMLDYIDGDMIVHDAILFGVMGVIGIAIALFAVVVAILGARKKRIVGADNESGTNLAPENVERVSFKHAKERITSPEILRGYRKQRKLAMMLLVPGFLLIIIPALMYAYTYYKSANSNASDRQAQYYLADYDAVKAANGNETATITLNKVPYLIYSDSTEDFYILDYNGLYFMGIIDGKDYSKIQKEINENGKYTLYGYLEVPDDEAKDRAIDYLNNSFGTNYGRSDYEKLFGKYALNVEDNYSGEGVPLERIKNFLICAAVFIACFLLFGFTSLSKSRYIITSMRYLSDLEFSQMEKELTSDTSLRFPQNLILTDNFVVMLPSYSAFKDSTANENAVFFAKYSDIKWIYPYNHVMGGKVTNYGVAVYGPKVGKSIIIGLQSNENGEAIFNEIMSILADRCPGVAVGYTEENKKKFGISI